MVASRLADPQPVLDPAGMQEREAESGRSRLPEGQPEARKAWVERALARHREGPSVQERLARIPSERLDYYRVLVEVMSKAKAEGKRLLLDTGCGTGESTRRRVQKDCFILGLDKSLDRLKRGSEQLPALPIWTGEVCPSLGGVQEALHCAAVLARAELSELATVMRDAKCSVDRMDFMYPNPWPKSQHFGRRWYGHPVWLDLVELSADMELRTNWHVYAQEFAHALALSVGDNDSEPKVERFEPPAQEGLTHFESKYAQAGHVLYRVRGRGAAAVGS